MEKKQEKIINLFGLIGKNIAYSFSQSYFNLKFKNEKLHKNSYVNFDIQDILTFKEIIKKNKNLKGLNVTIPYKEVIIPFLDELSEDASKIGAVNTIKISSSGLKGFNTDHYGFKKSLLPYLDSTHKKALILGTGGASKAIAYVLKELRIPYTFVSRNASKNTLLYENLDAVILKEHTLLINCTPLGTHPNIDKKPAIPYEFITSKHLLYDLIYNPEETLFLKLGKKRGAKTCNGLEMLKLQAEKAWEIWNN